ncbi:MAG: hypothetical protein M1822_007733 [Bathelium mastoideum]|nr:MAG: hypothetical protein M1822_007733 [Bathelium mastoideum]
MLWISADTLLNIEDSFSRIAHQLGLADASVQNSNQLMELVKRWLLKDRKKDPAELGSNWLLIYDNVEDPSLLLSSWPSTARGTVILTTRNPDVARRFADNNGRIDMQPFSIEDGQNFLLKIIKGHAFNNVTEQELTTTKDICSSVGGLPLALDMLGSYIVSCGISLPRFVEMHPGFERDLIFDNNIKIEDAFSYQSSIDTIWKLTRISSRCGAVAEGKARTLIQMLAFLDTSGVPLSLFEKKSQEDMLFEGPDNLVEFPNLKALLENPFGTSKNLNMSVAILRQNSLINRDQMFYVEKGQYSRALHISQKAISICEKALQNGVHPGYSSWFVRDMSSYLYNVQASVELEMVSSDSSLALHIKIRDIREYNKRTGNAADEMWIGAANGNIAVSLMTENRATEALSILDDLLQRDDLASNRDYYYLNNASLCLRLLERLDEAHQCCEKALAAARNLQGEESLSTAL